jgi:hypothetical protein
MTQKLATPLEQQIVGPHIRHVNPHPQYALAADVNATTPSVVIPATEVVGSAGTIGISTAYARADHVHPMPGLASSSAAGFMSATDKARLDALTSGQVISPAGGALFDYDHGELVWDVDVVPAVQVMAS